MERYASVESLDQDCAPGDVDLLKTDSSSAGLRPLLHVLGQETHRGIKKRLLTLFTPANKGAMFARIRAR